MTIDTIAAPTLPAVAQLPGSLGVAVAGFAERARLHDLYDEHGARIYDDSTHLVVAEVRAMRQVLRRHPGPVLELAAGSGRLTVPLLRMGRAVTALEINQSMIDILHENVDPLPDPVRRLLTVHRGDMTDFELDTRFGAAVLGAASISILDEPGRARMFAAVRRHLRPGGVLLFSIVVPLGPAGDGGTADQRGVEAEVDGEVDVIMDVTGQTGRRYRVHEHRADGAIERLVGVYPIDADGGIEPVGNIPVCVGVHRVLDLPSVRREVVAAGLVVREEHNFDYNVQGLAEIFLEVGEPR